MTLMLVFPDTVFTMDQSLTHELNTHFCKQTTQQPSSLEVWARKAVEKMGVISPQDG